jgi:hypothetical protein
MNPPSPLQHTLEYEVTRGKPVDTNKTFKILTAIPNPIEGNKY